MQQTANRYFIINKPYNMVSQFKSTHDVQLLGNLNFNFPQGTHAVGRLDNDSEGLLILTTNKKLTRLLFLSEVPHARTYLVQINNTLSDKNFDKLRNGVDIKIKKGVYYKTKPTDVQVINRPQDLCWLGNRVTAYQPFTWLLITLTEGKYHQVRKMINAVKHRCKRLIRISIEDLTLGMMEPGCVKEISEDELFTKLKIGASNK
ncbi:MAG: pseudouridine synthase [Ferruginibacter sp.]|nr:rRNA pseudouridine synthase [Bacteroidota bacterium]MBX2918706.1 rRNA pseudouridine synthase [Ferruginibacter sp.]MCB0708522.1 rRNA pseudouridine synthase [Chitinophagaceae bacterium]